MEISERKSLVGVLIFALLQAMYVFNNFSILGCACTVLMFLILILKTVVKKYVPAKMGTEWCSLTANISVLCSIGLLNIGLVTFFSNVQLESMVDVLESGFDTLIWLVISGAILIISGHVVNFFSKSKIMIYIKYIAAGFIEVLLPEMAEIPLPDVYIAFVIVFNLCFLLLTIIEDRYNAKNSFAFDISILTFVTIMLISIVDLPLLSSIIEKVVYINLLLPWSVGNLLIIISAFVISVVFCYVLDREKSNQNTFNGYQDAASIFIIGYDLVFLMFLNKTASAISYVFVLLMLMVNIVVFLVKGNKSKKKLFSVVDLDNKISFIIYSSIVILLLIVASAKGFADVVILGTICIISFALLNKFKYKWNVVLFSITIFSLDLALHWYNSEEIFLLIISVFIIANVVLLGFTFQNPRYEIKQTISNYIIVFAAFFLSVLPVFNNGISCSVEYTPSYGIEVAEDESEKIQSSEKIIVSLEPRGQNNEILEVEYYWKSNFDKPISVTVDKNNTFSINKEQDTLVIYCYDANGVQSVHKYMIN